MDRMLWHKAAAISGMSALALGTYGAHVFKPQNPSYKDVWHTASLYHLVHTAALLAAPITKRPHIFGGLLTAGILAFSGTKTKEKGQEERPRLLCCRNVQKHVLYFRSSASEHQKCSEHLHKAVD